MARKFYLINFILIVIVVFLAVENYDEWTKPTPVGKEASSAKPKGSGPGSPLLASAGAKKEPPAPAQFRPISDKNIFSPDRKEFPIPAIVEAAKKPSVRPNISLFGVAIGEEFHSALVTNPTRRADRGERETVTVKVGDKLGEYAVGKILADRITLESSGDSFDVLLYDPSKQKKRPVVIPTPSPAPGPAVVPPPSPVPPRPYTPPGGTPPVPLPRPGGVITPPPQPGGLTGREMIRGRIDPRRAVPTPPPRAPKPAPVPDDDEDDDEN